MKKTFADIHQMTESELAVFNNGLRKKYASEAKALMAKEKQLSTEVPNLMAGTLDDVNKIIWPFFFVSSELDDTALILPPNNTQSAYINITQEAGFVVTEIIKTVFSVADLGGGAYDLTYIDPKDLTDGLTNGLDFILRDSQSSRTFHYSPMSVDHIGDAKNTWKLDTPIYFAPNTSVEVKFSNNHPTLTYAPFFTFKGYRVRLDDAREMLGQVID